MDLRTEVSRIFALDISSLLHNIKDPKRAEEIRNQVVDILYEYYEFYNMYEKDVYVGFAVFIWYVRYSGQFEVFMNKTRSELLDLAIDFCHYRYSYFRYIHKRRRKVYRRKIQTLYLESHP